MAFVVIAAAIAAFFRRREKPQHRDTGVESIFDGTAGPLLKQQFLQAQRMEALGRLSGGVAHDFNNILTIVRGCADMAIAHVDADHPARKDLEEIRLAASNGVTLTRQLLTFSRTSLVPPTPVNVNEVVRPLAQMLRRLVGEHIDFVTLLEGDVGHVVVAPGLIEQVVMNLVVNARDAMPSGGTLTVRTNRAALDSTRARSRRLGATGQFVTIAVADTGRGLSQEEQRRIFEPFFTTKGPGYGTGLGLATVQTIVQDAGGSVVVESMTGRGSTFTVYLPLVEPSSGASPRAGSEGALGPSTNFVVSV